MLVLVKFFVEGISGIQTWSNDQSTGNNSEIHYKEFYITTIKIHVNDSNDKIYYNHQQRLSFTITSKLLKFKSYNYSVIK